MTIKNLLKTQGSQAKPNYEKIKYQIKISAV